MTRHQRATLAVTCVGFFMVLLDVSIVNTALPTIGRTLDAGLSELQWVVDAYTLAFAVLLLTWGTLADRVGRKRIFAVGMAVFTLGSLLCGLAGTSLELNIARALQGLGGAALAPTSLALLATAFPDPRQRIRAVSLWAAISGLALGIGPTVGGILVDTLGWRSVFFCNVPVGLVCLVFGRRVLQESSDPAARRVDVAGQVLSVAWLGAATYGFIELGNHGLGTPAVAVPLGAAALLLGAFVAVEHRSADPMLPLALFRSRLFSATAVVTFGVGFALISLPFFMSQFFQGVAGLSALQSGLRVLAFTLMFSAFAPLAGRLAARWGFWVPVTVGGVACAAGLGWLATLTPGTDYLALAPRLALCGAGFGLMLSPLSAAALASVDPRRSGLASSAANTSRQTGTVVGIALLGALAQSRAAASAAHQLQAVPAALRTRVAGALAQAAAGQPPAHPVPGITAAGLHHVAATAFVNGIRAAYLIDAVVVLAAAVVALAWLRPRPPARAVAPGTAEPAETPAEVAAAAAAEAPGASPAPPAPPGRKVAA